MKTNQPFNNEELNKGFQMDTSLLTHEQLTHVLQIFEARGTPVGLKQSDAWKWLGFYLGGDSRNMDVEFSPVFNNHLPVIDYPTLCRDAVQLEPNSVTEFIHSEDCRKAWEYWLSVGGSSDNKHFGNSIALVWEKRYENVYLNLFNGGLLGTFNKKIVSSEKEFEQRLRGIYPVVRENRTTETPRYFKSKESQRIVKATSEIKENRFKGIVVIPFGSDEVGEEAVWIADRFVECDYTPKEPVIEFVGEVSPATEQSKPQSPLTPYGRYVQELEQENAQLKAENLRAREYTNELTELLGKSQITIADLEAENLKLKEESLKDFQQERLTSEPVEPVYDANWLRKVIGNYNSNYGFGGRSNLVIFRDDALDAKTSATIILNALAKHLNPLFWANIEHGMWSINQSEQSGKYKPFQFTNYKASDGIFTSEAAAEKAISILTNFPEVLPNYFKP